MKIKTLMGLVFTAAGFLSCEDSKKSVSDPTYELVWSDEFDYNFDESRGYLLKSILVQYLE